MQTPSQRSRWKYLAFILLLLSGGRLAAQTATQSVNNIPQQAVTTAATKANTKSNTVTNNALNKMDSASDKAFKGFTGLFKKKPKPKTPPADSAKVRPPDSTVIAKP